jgi:MFS family permease
MLNSKHPVAGNSIIKNATRDFVSTQEVAVNEEIMDNGKVGMLLAMKAFMQLFFNPIVGNLSAKFGYKSFIFFGTINLLLASLSKKIF